jgi:hypothetical protein
MSSFIKILKDSFNLLLEQPKLFVPKIIVSFLQVPFYILLPYYFLSLYNMLLSGLVPSFEVLVGEYFIPLFAIFFFSLLVDFIDFMVLNPMYSLMVHDFFSKKQVVFSKAFKVALKKSPMIFAGMVSIILVMLAVLFPVFVFYFLALFSNNIFLILLSVFSVFAVSFLLLVVFYLAYPVLSLENLGFVQSMKAIVKLSLKNKRDVSKAAALMYLFSIVSLLLGFAIEFLSSQEFVFAQAVLGLFFIFTRLLLAVFSTYQYVLNPVFYIEKEKGLVKKS